CVHASPVSPTASTTNSPTTPNTRCCSSTTTSASPGSSAPSRTCRCTRTASAASCTGSSPSAPTSSRRAASSRRPPSRCSVARTSSPGACRSPTPRPPPVAPSSTGSPPYFHSIPPRCTTAPPSTLSPAPSTSPATSPSPAPRSAGSASGCSTACRGCLTAPPPPPCSPPPAISPCTSADPAGHRCPPRAGRCPESCHPRPRPAPATSRPGTAGSGRALRGAPRDRRPTDRRSSGTGPAPRCEYKANQRGVSAEQEHNGNVTATGSPGAAGSPPALVVAYRESRDEHESVSHPVRCRQGRRTGARGAELGCAARALPPARETYPPRPPPPGTAEPLPVLRAGLALPAVPRRRIRAGTVKLTGKQPTRDRPRHVTVKPFGNRATRHDQTCVRPGWRVDHLLLAEFPNGFSVPGTVYAPSWRPRGRGHCSETLPSPEMIRAPTWPDARSITTSRMVSNGFGSSGGSGCPAPSAIMTS